MNVCMISTRHCVDDARIVHKESMSLKNSGHNVTLLFSCNSKGEFVRPNEEIIVAGKGKDNEAEYMGMRVIGFKKKQGIFGKMTTYLEISKLAASLQCDVYHVHEADLALAIALRTKKILKKKGKDSFVIHDMHEFPPGEIVDHTPSFMKKIVYLALVLWDKMLIKNVDYIFYCKPDSSWIHTFLVIQ